MYIKCAFCTIIFKFDPAHGITSSCVKLDSKIISLYLRFSINMRKCIYHVHAIDLYENNFFEHVINLTFRSL